MGGRRAADRPAPDNSTPIAIPTARLITPVAIFDDVEPFVANGAIAATTVARVMIQPKNSSG